ncbi:adenylate/guanylate cyclase [Planoprotostelium fungivorum]|uniref:Adenylate/guanylate cyclase n=1 Tax=Planoprotostelium fungivorum TaxID=1890364 RepID=A0A2P6NUD9_9EUKA|nr:adenylate/guanylate cyclase [Planoprotostelium fungivorum]
MTDAPIVLEKVPPASGRESPQDVHPNVPLDEPIPVRERPRKFDRSTLAISGGLLLNGGKKGAREIQHSKILSGIVRTRAIVKKWSNKRKRWYHITIFSLPYFNIFTFEFLQREHREGMENASGGFRPVVRMTAAICIFIHIFYGGVELIYTREAMAMLAIPRFGIALPFLSALYAMLYIPRMKKYYTYIMSLFTLVWFAACIASGRIAPTFSSLYYSSVTWPIVFSFVSFGFHAFLATALFIPSLIAICIIDKEAAFTVFLIRQLIFQIVYLFQFAITIGIFTMRSWHVSYAVQKEWEELRQERETSDQLLLNVMPESIAARVKKKEVVADGHKDCTVLFAKVNDENLEFRPDSPAMITTRLGYQDSVTSEHRVSKSVEAFTQLHEIFSAFDARVSLFGVEKIKTIGQTYMVVGGVPDYEEDHCEAVAKFALDLIEVVDNYNKNRSRNISVRIGIHTGPIVAGVIGNLKTVYDLWGDTCNVASRMESNGVKGCVSVTEDVRKLLEGKFNFEDRGSLNIKGKGKMHAYFLSAMQDTNKPLRMTVKFSHILQQAQDPKEALSSIASLTPTVGLWHAGAAQLSRYARGTLHNRFFAWHQHIHLVTLTLRENEMGYWTHTNRTFNLLIVQILTVVREVTTPFVPFSSDTWMIYGFVRIGGLLVYVVGIVVQGLFPARIDRYTQLFSFLMCLPEICHSLINGCLIDEQFYWSTATAALFVCLISRLRFLYAAPLTAIIFVMFKVLNNVPMCRHLSKEDNVTATLIFSIFFILLVLARYVIELGGRIVYHMYNQLEKGQEETQREKERAEELLQNILPLPIVRSLKVFGRADPEEFQDVTVLSGDIVGFTNFCSDKSAIEVVSVLSELFCQFDALTTRFGLEKLKTVGDAFLVAGGLPIRSEDHAMKILYFAKEMLEVMKTFNRVHHTTLAIRIGIHTGPCVAGIIGVKRFAYEVLGEAIIVASLTESLGQANRIHVTERTVRRVQDGPFLFQPSNKRIQSPSKHLSLNCAFLLTEIISDDGTDHGPVQKHFANEAMDEINQTAFAVQNLVQQIPRSAARKKQPLIFTNSQTLFGDTQVQPIRTPPSFAEAIKSNYSNTLSPTDTPNSERKAVKRVSETIYRTNVT